MAITRFYKRITPQKIKWTDKSFEVNLIFRSSFLCPPSITPSSFQSRIQCIQQEHCYYVESTDNLTGNELSILKWLFKDPQNTPESITASTTLPSATNSSTILEIGPRMNISTPSSTNSVSILQNVDIKSVVRVELSSRYFIQFNGAVTSSDHESLLSHLMDRMTQCEYTESNIPKHSFNEQFSTQLTSPDPRRSWHRIPIVEEDRAALERIDSQLGLAFDDWDLDYYTQLFRDKLQRNPTTVEIFDCAQSNSEHSRHWFFKGRIVLDGEPMTDSLIDMIIATQRRSNQNNTIKFSDNSSAIRGYRVACLQPGAVNKASQVGQRVTEMDLIFTAETHNMPTAVEPFSGATTGTGGRIRDVQAVGRGGLPIAGTAGYCVGFLNIPGYELEYERKGLKYPKSFADPLKILIRASDGASDYGNKFGEPVIAGFVTSYGFVGEDGMDREEFVKPIMFSAGIGLMPSALREKHEPKKGYLLAKLGGPVYRIGVGGGAASSVVVQGTNEAELDFNAVQRGDAEMENKLNRVIRGCVELGERNPIVAIHDQGAGGNGNVLKELVEKTGAKIFTKEFSLGDPTLTTLELWGAEYQESNAIVCRSEDRRVLQEICDRERCPVNFVGVVEDDGIVMLIEGEMNGGKEENNSTDHPFNMHLDDILGKMPQKEYKLNTEVKKLRPLILPESLNFQDALRNLLSVVSVGSKRFLTNKVDRSVTGLIAQQQCVGPLQVPLSDFAVCAASYFSTEGIASSIGTQPLKGVICPKAGARMSVAEALSNLVFVGISALADVKCSGNWMWPAKLPGEGAKLYVACREMCEFMGELGIAVDGGKDSLSMATRVGGGDKAEVVKSPDTLVISTYVQCPDVRVKVTPDLKRPGMGGGESTGELIWVNVSEGKFRLGGSAFVQSMGQRGDSCPTVDRADLLKDAFNITQSLLRKKLLLAGHDISEGGLMVCLLEMAFGGMCGLHVDIPKIGEDVTAMEVLFAEEIGWVLEVAPENLIEALSEFKGHGVPVYHIGQAVGYGVKAATVEVKYDEKVVLPATPLITLMQQWERTSFEIEKLQMDRECAVEEWESLERRTGPKYKCTFDPDLIYPVMAEKKFRVAVIREEGINGDREMIATLMNAHFEVHDVTMWDLINGKATLENYRGVVFPGGFSYADTLGSAKGWAASIKFHGALQAQFNAFRGREDTFSIGVCNGCQLMGFLGWIGGEEGEVDENVPDISLVKNRSGRYESRWSSIRVEEGTNSIFLKRMAGSVLGCWIAHGEGQFSFKDERVLDNLKAANCVAMSYVDDEDRPTEWYPMNPNGSKGG